MIRTATTVHAIFGELCTHWGSPEALSFHMADDPADCVEIAKKLGIQGRGLRRKDLTVGIYSDSYQELWAQNATVNAWLNEMEPVILDNILESLQEYLLEERGVA